MCGVISMSFCGHWIYVWIACRIGQLDQTGRDAETGGLPVSFGSPCIGFKFIHDQVKDVWGVQEVPTHLPRSWGAFNEVLGRTWRAQRVQ